MAKPQAPIGLLLRTLDGLIDQRFEQVLGERDVSRRQWQLLRTLTDGPASADVLSERVAVFLGDDTVQEHLDPLVARGYVEGAYALTEAGRSFVDELALAVGAIRELTVRGLAEGEYDRTVATLQAMIDNLR